MKCCDLAYQLNMPFHAVPHRASPAITRSARLREIAAQKVSASDLLYRSTVTRTNKLTGALHPVIENRFSETQYASPVLPIEAVAQSGSECSGLLRPADGRLMWRERPNFQEQPRLNLVFGIHPRTPGRQAVPEYIPSVRVSSYSGSA